MTIKKYDHVKLKKRCDSLFLEPGDTGQVVSDILEDDYVAVAFDTPFHDSHSCDGYVQHGYGWYVMVQDLEAL